MSLKDIFCQDKAIGSLLGAFGSSRMAHAYIFAGINGVGKLTTAREFAKMVLCSGRSETHSQGRCAYDSCGRCESCRAMAEDRHPDFHLITKELRPFTVADKKLEAKQDLPISVIREFFLEKAANRPTLSSHSVYAVRESERLNASSQNAMLKVLEEPPAHCLIILLCSRVDRLLPTTQSRCQIVRFNPVDHNHIVKALMQAGIDTAQADYWARFSDGSLGDALHWAGLELKEGNCYDIKRSVIDALSRQGLADSLALADQLNAAAKTIADAWSTNEPDTSKTDINRQARKGLLRMIIAAFTDVMKVSLDSGQDLVNNDQRRQIETLTGRFDSERAAEAIARIYESIRWIEANVNEKLVFEDLLISLASGAIINVSAM
jgi:DNA polymerase-3 subunit delta'